MIRLMISGRLFGKLLRGFWTILGVSWEGRCSKFTANVKMELIFQQRRCFIFELTWTGFGARLCSFWFVLEPKWEHTNLLKLSSNNWSKTLPRFGQVLERLGTQKLIPKSSKKDGPEMGPRSGLKPSSPKRESKIQVLYGVALAAGATPATEINGRD